MRFYFLGPRILGIRPGISLGPEDFRARRSRPQAAASGNLVDIGQPFVYVIRGDHDRCKIGISGNPNARMAQLSTASAFPLSFAYIGVVESNNATNVEREAHAILDRYRVNGEWFSCPAELAVAAVNAAGARIGEKICNIDPARADEIISLAIARETPQKSRRGLRLWEWLLIIGGVLWTFAYYSGKITSP